LKEFDEFGSDRLVERMHSSSSPALIEDSCASLRTNRRYSGAPEMGVFNAQRGNYFAVI
jgi:hypothetical protein